MSYPLTALAAMLTICSSAAHAAEPTETSLRAADAEQMRIIAEKDVKALQTFMHQNYILNSPANVIMRKAQVLQTLSRGGMASETFERTIEGLEITGDVGVVMGQEVILPAAGSQLAGLYGRSILHRRFTNVFRFEAGRWEFLARQATVVSTPLNR